MTEEEFIRDLTEKCAVSKGQHILCAVSGGADSVALLLLLKASVPSLQIRLSAAHAEHGIRGKESLEDLHFVEALCRELDVSLYTAHLNVPENAALQHDGLESTARRLRYEFLNDTASRIGADSIALAHHEQDQAETVLFRAARGCDIRGLAAMKEREGNLIRPLLHCTPSELKEYLAKNNQAWREDSTNQDILYARNRIRHKVLPELQQISSQASRHIAKLSEAAARDEDYFSQLVLPYTARIHSGACGVFLTRKEVTGLHPALTTRILVKLLEAGGSVPSQDIIEEAFRSLISGEMKKLNLPEDRYLYLGESWLAEVRNPLIEAEKIEDGAENSFGSFKISEAKADETGDGIISQVIPERYINRLYVRCRKNGDKMIPFGHKTEELLKKLMNDRKIPAALKYFFPVVFSDEQILWTVGVRASECCRLHPGEKGYMLRYNGKLPIQKTEEMKNG